jgi:hypothetical protein
VVEIAAPLERETRGPYAQTLLLTLRLYLPVYVVLSKPHDALGIISEGERPWCTGTLHEILVLFFIAGFDEGNNLYPSCHRAFIMTR